MSKSFMINRRAALGGAAALAAARPSRPPRRTTSASSSAPGAATIRGCSTKNIDTPLLVPQGLGRACTPRRTPPPRKAKMMAEKSLRRGTSDVQGLSANDMYEMNEQGLVEQLDYSKMPNAKNLIPAMKYPYGIGHIYSGKVVLYNPKLMAAPDGLRRHARSQARQQARHHRHPVPVHHGGGGASPRAASMSNFEPGKERLIACKKAGARIYPSNEAFAQALKTEEIACGIMWKARAVQWQNAGINVRDGGAQGRRADVRLGLRHAEERAQQGRRLRLARRHDGAVGAGGLRRRHGLQPDRHQRQGAAPTCRSASASPTRSRSAWSISTTATWPRTTSAFQDWWNKSFKG